MAKKQTNKQKNLQISTVLLNAKLVRQTIHESNPITLALFGHLHFFFFISLKNWTQRKFYYCQL